jgi:hypothetical protein
MEMYISAFKECTREETSIWQDQYAFQRVPEVTSTGGRMPSVVLGPLADSNLLLEFLGYRYLEVRLESCQWLVEKNSESELKRVFKV